VSALDGDGNEVAGVRLADLSVPLATHLPWNLRDPESGAPEQIVPMIGSSHAFPTTKQAREASGDLRPSIEERYASKAAYLDAVREAAEGLAGARHLLLEDVDAVVADAGARWDWASGGRR
jgi:hypothetical protein